MHLLYMLRKRLLIFIATLHFLVLDLDIELSDDDEYETVIYNGPDKPYVIVENSKPSLPKYIHPNVKHEPTSFMLAKASAQYGGLLSPDFFKSTPHTSSSESSSCSSSGFASNIPPGISLSTWRDNSMKMPFSFPTVVDSSQEKNINAVIHNMERVEILDEDPDEVDETEWVEWPKKFIDQNGFHLGVQPGNFYKNQSRPCFYVKLPHRSNYEVLLTNNNQVACDLDLYVNGQLTNALRLPAGATRSIDGPAYSKSAFKIFRSQDTPEGKKVKKGDRHNGIVKAVFTPERIGSLRFRAISEPLHKVMQIDDFWQILEDSTEERKKRSFTCSDQDKVERSLDMSQVVEGVTLLQGKKRKKKYAPAPDMDTDSSKRVVLQLRLIASLIDEMDPTEEEVYDLEPPPLPARRQ